MNVAAPLAQGLVAHLSTFLLNNLERVNDTDVCMGTGVFFCDMTGAQPNSLQVSSSSSSHHPSGQQIAPGLGSLFQERGKDLQ